MSRRDDVRAEAATLRLSHAGMVASDRAVAIGRQLARRVFATRGNHHEVHLAEVTLAAMLAIAAEQGARLPAGEDRCTCTDPIVHLPPHSADADCERCGKPYRPEVAS